MHASLRTVTVIVAAPRCGACTMQKALRRAGGGASDLAKPGAGHRRHRPLRSALVGPVRGSGPRRARDRLARREYRRPPGRRPPRTGARVLGRGRSRPVPHRAGGCQHRSAQPGDSRVLGGAPQTSRPIALVSTRSGSWTSSAAFGPRCGPRRRTAEGLEASLDDARVIVVAEIARNYFELRGLQQQLEVLDRSLTNQRESLRLTTVRREAGIGEEQDVASAAARVAATEASVPPVRAALARREHRLAVLLGRRPGTLEADLSPRAYPPLTRALAVGPPEGILRRASRRPCRRASTRGGDRRRRHRRGGSVSARDVDRLSRLPRRTRQPLRHRRLRCLGRDAGTQLGGVRHRQRS